LTGASGEAERHSGALLDRIFKAIRQRRPELINLFKPHLDVPDGLRTSSIASSTSRGQELIEAFRREAGEKGFDVIVDYLWGPPTEAVLAAITRAEFAVAGSETRLVEVGETAGPTITLSAAVLRSAALTILGTAGIPPGKVLTATFQQVMNHAACGKLLVDSERVPLMDIEGAWERDVHGRRLGVIP
jgi:NADPH2:quinone reductase